MPIINHPGARTRALYMWEAEQLEPATMKVTRGRAKMVTDHFWADKKSKRPTVKVRRFKGLSYTEGRAEIHLNERNATETTLIHELVHACGYGSEQNPHSVGFVKHYLKMLTKYCFLSNEFLIREAKRRRLI